MEHQVKGSTGIELLHRVVVLPRIYSWESNLMVTNTVFIKISNGINLLY